MLNVFLFVPEERKLDNPFAQLFIIVVFFTICYGKFNDLADFGGWALNMQRYVYAMVC
jgi:hypothetical protein